MGAAIYSHVVVACHRRFSGCLCFDVAPAANIGRHPGGEFVLPGTSGNDVDGLGRIRGYSPIHGSGRHDGRVVWRINGPVAERQPFPNIPQNMASFEPVPKAT